MPERTSFSFKVAKLKFHMACPRYSAGGALKIAGSKGPAAFWADKPAARRTRETANRDIGYTPFPSNSVANVRLQRVAARAGREGEAVPRPYEFVYWADGDMAIRSRGELSVFLSGLPAPAPGLVRLYRGQTRGYTDPATSR